MIPVLKRAKVSALLIPGIGTVDHLHMAHDCGIGTIRVATHCTEADVSEQHIGLGRKLGLDTVGFLMMAHMLDGPSLVKQALLMESYGANCIYITDSAGYMLPDDVRERLEPVRQALQPETELGFHGHHNLAMGIANSLAAVEAGASRIDGSAAGLGAGAGNTPLEVFNAVCERMGIVTGVGRVQAFGCGGGSRLPHDGSHRAHRSGRADAGLRGRLFLLPAVRETRRAEVQDRRTRNSR